MKTETTNHVLIIDDDVDTCFLLNRILDAKNIRAVCVNTLQQARVVFETMQPSLIFLDNNLPDGYGLNFIPLIRDKFPKAQIIMITAHSNDFNKRAALMKGAVLFMTKPFNSDEIYRALDYLAKTDSRP
ncbi:MAG TPA: response regulator [Bacteroidales bacterium]|nr:response regulator [Bacteroidales bacterium]